MELNVTHNENCMQGMKRIEDASIDCCVTSPPYLGLRDYGIATSTWEAVEYAPMPGMTPITVPGWKGCLGLERTIDDYIGHMVAVCREIRRVLKDGGTLWINIGDSYAGSRFGEANYPSEKKWKQSTNSGSTQVKGRGSERYGLKPKDLMMMPARLALALQADGWYLRQDIIWSKSNPMPESVTDRCTKSHDHIFMFAKQPKYYYDAEAIKEPCVQEEFANGFRGGAYCNHATFDNAAGGTRKQTGNKKYYQPAGSIGAFGTPQSRRREKIPSGWDTDEGTHGAFHREGRESKKRGEFQGKTKDFKGREAFRAVRDMRNKRDVWTVATKPFSEAHFATFPPALIEPCILAGCPLGGIALDPFMGSGTTGYVANMCGRNYIGFEIKREYCDIERKRTSRAAYQMKLGIGD